MSVGLTFALLVFLLGASVGSFLNVVIYRVPHGLSLVRPPSRCPACETPIKPWHNLPVMGWLLVRGRCASCGVPLSLRYPTIELLCGLLAVALFHDFAGGPLTAETLIREGFVVDVITPFIFYFAFAAILVAVTFIDLDWFIIPDGLSLPGVPLGIAVSAAVGLHVGVDWSDALIGAVAGAGVLIAVILIYGFVTGREGMGGGDWKLLALIGAWLGWQGLPLVLLLASLQGILFAVVLGRAFAVESIPDDPGAPARSGTSADAAPSAAAGPAPVAAGFGQLAIPFGPFLSLGALEMLLFRDEIRALAAAWLTV